MNVWNNLLICLDLSLPGIQGLPATSVTSLNLLPPEEADWVCWNVDELKKLLNSYGTSTYTKHIISTTSSASCWTKVIIPTLRAKQRDRKRRKSVYTNLVSTFCYLSLEGELWQFLHRRRGQCLLRGHPHAAKDDNDHGEDEEHTARHVDEYVGVVVLLLRAHCFGRRRSHRMRNMTTYYHINNNYDTFSTPKIFFLNKCEEILLCSVAHFPNGL